MPLFRSDAYEVEDWAANNMDWSDVRSHAVQVAPPRPRDGEYQEGWVNGNKRVVWGDSK